MSAWDGRRLHHPRLFGFAEVAPKLLNGVLFLLLLSLILSVGLERTENIR